MKNYSFADDLKIIRKYYALSQNDLALALGMSRVTIARYETEAEFPSSEAMEKFYSYIYAHHAKVVKLNKTKTAFLEDDKRDRILLFHGARQEISGLVDIHHTAPPVDFGDAFYVGQSLEQAACWVSDFPSSSIYCFYADLNGLKGLTLSVSKEWMIAILYYRGKLGKYANHSSVVKIIQNIEEHDYIIAPIADNSMYRILDNFGLGKITDEQCSHALSATDLGKQYVFRTSKGCMSLSCASRLYLCKEEKEDYLRIKRDVSKEGEDKAALAIEKYRRKGKFIDELFK